MINREWKRHKYIRKEGNRYIYPEDLNKKSIGAPGSNIKRAGNEVFVTQTSSTGSGVIGGIGAGNMAGDDGKIDASSILERQARNKEAVEKMRSRGSRRVKNITGKSEDFNIKGKGLGTGPVGNAAGYSGRPGTTSGDTISLENIGTGSSSGERINRSGSKSINIRKTVSTGKKRVNSVKLKPISSLRFGSMNKAKTFVKSLIK